MMHYKHLVTQAHLSVFVVIEQKAWTPSTISQHSTCFAVLIWNEISYDQPLNANHFAKKIVFFCQSLLILYAVLCSIRFSSVNTKSNNRRQETGVNE